jgi:hypothetical protein
MTLSTFYQAHFFTEMCYLDFSGFISLPLLRILYFCKCVNKKNGEIMQLAENNEVN